MRCKLCNKNSNNTRKSFFCSKKCSNLFNARDRYKDNRIHYKCEECHKNTSQKLAVYNRAKHHFCSPQCSNTFSGNFKSKENHWNWKGGITKESHRARTNTAYRHWQIAVFTRDNYICQKCGSKDKLEAHHILGFKENEQHRYLLSNGLTLCKACHVLTYNQA